MAKVFLSYAREDEGAAKQLADCIGHAGHKVWWDRHIQGGSRFSAEIDRELKSAEAVVVLWSPTSVESAWVQDEAAEGRDTGRLVPVSLNGSRPPLGFRQFHTVELAKWDGEGEPDKLGELLEAIAKTAVNNAPAKAPPPEPKKESHGASVCVLPFINMSGDPEQEYFSDGITEDIITDLSKVSALLVIARNTAFTFKGRPLDVKEVAFALGVSHVLEGSVRRAGARVRITAQLIDSKTGGHLWADRYDRDLDDIFAIQDEISKAIVEALKIKLLPGEKKAIEDRGTESAEAYNLFLMARQQWTWGSYGNSRRDEAIVRFCTRAVKIDPRYAQAWSLMALAQAELRWWHGKDDDPLPAVEKALEINPELAEPHCVKVRYFEQLGQLEQADEELQEALRLDPDSWSVNREAARLMFRQDRMNDAIRYWETASQLMDSDFHSPLMLQTCYLDAGDEAGAMSAARRTLERAESALSKDPTNGAALSAGSSSLSLLGEIERGKDWLQRALLLDPDNMMVLYNAACGLTYRSADLDAALDLLEQYFENVESPGNIHHAEIDPDMDPVRDDPRFGKMLLAAKQRLGIDA